MSGYATITTKKIYEDIVRLSGLDPSTAGLSAAQKAVIAELINDRLLEAWEAEFWPDLMLVEQREYRETYNAVYNYSDGEEVYYDGSYYESQQDGNVGNTPGTDTDWWVEVEDDFVRTISFEQEGETVIGAVDAQQCVYGKDPRVYRGADLTPNVSVYNHSILVSAENAPVQPWVKFRPVCPEFSLTDWAIGTDYSIGDLVYVSTTGHTYKALTANTGKTPVTYTDDWEAVGFPKLFRTYVKHAVNADRTQEDRARSLERARADEELDRLRDIQFEGTGNLRQAVYDLRR